MKQLLNRFSKKTIKNTCIIFFLLVVFIIISAYSYVDAVSQDLANSVFRLHVIANSDSKEDQELKYKVRDALLQYMNTLTQDMTDKQKVITIAQNHQEEFLKIAKQIIHENGYSYDVSVEIGNYAFPTKTYGDISFPSGYYDALRVKIGSSQGQNWWCVMFPPLCFVDVSSGVVPEESKQNLQQDLSEEEYTLIQKEAQDNADVSFKFKLIELFENIKIKMAEK